MKRFILGLVFLLYTVGSSGAQFEKQIEIFKLGCIEAAAGSFGYKAGYCTGTIAQFLEMLELIDPKSWNVCMPEKTGLLIRDYVNLVNSKSFLIRGTHPVTSGLINVLADAFPCNRR